MLMMGSGIWDKRPGTGHLAVLRQRSFRRHCFRCGLHEGHGPNGSGGGKRLHLFAVWHPPAVAGGIARAIKPKIVMGRQFAPGHQQLHRQMGHIGQALGKRSPQGLMLLPFGVCHADTQHLFKAPGNLGGGPFATAGTCGRGRRQVALAAGHIPQKTQKGRAARDKGFALQTGFFFRQPLFNRFCRKNLKIRGWKPKSFCRPAGRA
mgnify:CR=1 FL=1